MTSDDASNQKKQIADLYNRVAADYDHIGPTVFSDLGQRVVELVGISTGAQVLDIGAGRGANIFAAAEKVGETGQVVGIDLAEAMVQETRTAINQKVLKNATMLQMDAENLAFNDASFDYVLCSFAYFFFPNLERALSEFFRVLRPHGQLAVTLWGGNDERWQWYEDLLVAYHTQHHIPLSSVGGGGHRNLAEFKELLAHTGFVDIQNIPVETEAIYADEHEWWAAKWTHGARYPLERMDPDILKRFKAEVFAQMASLREDDGFHERWPIQCVLGTRPASLN